MNIHEYQAKKLLKEFGAPIPNGIVIHDIKDIEKKTKKLKAANLIVKAQIHAGGRGKAGGIKLVKQKEDLTKVAKSILGKVLVTNQTGSKGKKVNPKI